ncbi:hypothetical protein [Sneathiella sp.]|uniref:Npun_F0296 family exosortase-dependent surface protein n=1 Tax=Sneathiella sp. TaxID=1964365 RepID=UPI0035667580
MKNLISAFIGVAGAAFLLIAPAQSATVTWTNDVPVADTGVPHYTSKSATGAVYENVTTSQSGLYRSPWEGTALENIGTYTSVSADTYASYVFDTAVSKISFMWGSVDDYNRLEFYNNGAWVDFLAGSDSQLDSAQKTTGFILATVMAGGLFDEVRFISASNAFEYANLSAVPLPAALPLYGAGLAVMGFVGWRKRRKAAAVAA